MTFPLREDMLKLKTVFILQIFDNYQNILSLAAFQKKIVSHIYVYHVYYDH